METLLCHSFVPYGAVKQLSHPALRSLWGPLGNQFVIGLGFQQWNSKILLTLIVAKHRLVSLSSLHKENNEISIPLH